MYSSEAIYQLEMSINDLRLQVWFHWTSGIVFNKQPEAILSSIK